MAHRYSVGMVPRQSPRTPSALTMPRVVPRIDLGGRTGVFVKAILGEAAVGPLAVPVAGRPSVLAGIATSC